MDGVKFGLNKNGRVLIGDEMGLGKTLQVFIVKNGRSEIPFGVKLVIISYELLAKNEKFRHRYNVIICDESHYLKSFSAKRTQTITPLVRGARRAILLSGTPALNKPVELYQQLQALVCLSVQLPDFGRYEEFAGRYCEQEMNRFSHRMEYTHHKHTDELFLFLTNTVMIRRLKKEVQSQLPPKLRSRIPIEVSDKDMKEIRLKMELLNSTASTVSADEGLEIQQGSKEYDGNKNNVSQSIVSDCFTLTGKAKIKGVCDYIGYMIEADCKFLVFAHHREMLDALEEETIKRKVDYIRIDGSTPSEKREVLVKHFQIDKQCTVAILSITACGHGLTLTAAGTVVFAELYWVPGMMIQAEDRCHRMGTEHSTIDIHYLIAEETIDDKVWQILMRKWSAMTSTLNGMAEDLDARHVSKSSTGSPPAATASPDGSSSGSTQVTLDTMLKGTKRKAPGSYFDGGDEKS